jgi:hypothetical protein
MFRYFQRATKINSANSLFVYFSKFLRDVAFEMRGSELDLINFYKFHMFSRHCHPFLQSSVDPPRWIGWILIEYRPDTSKKWIPSRKVGIDYVKIFGLPDAQFWYFQLLLISALISSVPNSWKYWNWTVFVNSINHSSGTSWMFNKILIIYN